MKSIVLSAVLGVLASLFVSCAPGGGAPRALGHVYQDPRGMTFITVFEKADGAVAQARTIGDGSQPRQSSLSSAEFERFWSGLDEAGLSAHAVSGGSERFEAQNNHVVSKGTMPGGEMRTYAVPKARASAGLKKWIRELRARVGR